MDHLKTVISLIEAQEAKVRQCKAAVIDAIKKNDRAAGFLETVYRNAVVCLNQLKDERTALEVILAQKETSVMTLAQKEVSAVAKDIAEMKQIQAEMKQMLQLINKQLDLALKRKPKREESLRRTVLMKEAKAAEGRAVEPTSGSSSSAVEDSNDAPTTSGSDILKHDTRSDTRQVSSSGADARPDSGAEI
ncbi:hypothetical protein HDU77_011781 [Chytriomyces hyalinus]|nr:hypothetical protein HDU77_011781 [Chytriomyces hyalinus]